MIYDDKTIYMHEIDMLMRFLMVPCSENRCFDEFVTFYFSTKSTFSKMLKQFKNYLPKPDYTLNTMEKNQSLNKLSSKIFAEIE